MIQWDSCSFVQRLRKGTLPASRTADYNDFLHQEYFFRFGKDHAYRKLAGIYRAGLSVPLSDGKPETLDFARNFKDFVPVSQDIVQASEPNRQPQCQHCKSLGLHCTCQQRQRR